MADTEQFQILKEQLAINCDACSPPELSDADLESLLSGAANAVVWQADTVYSAGAIVVPDSLSAMSYRCISGGTSGATPPDWPRAPYWGWGWSGNPAALYSCCCWGGLSTVTDGGVTWQQAGPVSGLYDLYQATADGWLLKLGRAVTLVQTSSAGQSTALQLVFDHCQRMAAHWQPYRAA